MSKFSLLLGQGSSFDVEIIQSPNQTITVEIGTVGSKGEFKAQKAYTESFDFPTDLNCTHLRGSVSTGNREYIAGEVQCNGVQNSKVQEFIAGSRYVYTATPATQAKEVTIKYSAPGASSIEYTELKGYANGRDTLGEIARQCGYEQGTPKLAYPGDTIYSVTPWKDTLTGINVTSQAIVANDMALIPYTSDATDDFTGAVEATIGVPLNTWTYDSEHVDGYTSAVDYTLDYILKTNSAFLETALNYSGSPPYVTFRTSFNNEAIYFSEASVWLHIDEVEALLKHRYKVQLIANTVGDCYVSTGDDFGGTELVSGVPPFTKIHYSVGISRISRNFTAGKYGEASPIIKKLSPNATDEDRKRLNQEIINQLKAMVSNGTIINVLPCRDLNNFAKLKMTRL